MNIKIHLIAICLNGICLIASSGRNNLPAPAAVYLGRIMMIRSVD
jgi:hypothetical protein